MRRPAVFFCGAYIFGMAAEYFLKLNEIKLFIAVLFNASAMTGILFMSRVIRHKYDKKYLCLFFVLIFTGIFGAMQFSGQWNKAGLLKQYAGEYCEIRGRVVSVSEKDDEYHKMLVKVNYAEILGELPKEEKVLVSIYGSYEEYYKLQGREVSVKGLMEIPQGRRNPKAFDYKQYLKTKDIDVIMGVYPESIQVSDRIYNKYLNCTARINYIFKYNIYKLFDEEIAGLLMGMLFGDNSGLSEELYDSFQKNGICHVLAVSGLHIGALYMCVNAVFGGRRNLFVNITIITLLVFYASLANFSPSVIRAVIMIAIHMISKYLYCRYDMFTAGAITMALMVWGNPLLILNLGFQLSFTAIFTLAVIMPAATRIWNNRLTGILVIQGGIAPISAYAFNYFSFSAFIANIPVLFIGGILIPLGMLLLLISTVKAFFPLFDDSFFSAALNFFFRIVGIIVEFFSKLLMFINQTAFMENISFKYVTSPPLWAIFLYYGALFFICSEMFRILWQRGLYGKISKLLVSIICMALLFGNFAKDGFEDVQMTFVDVGQGDCLMIRTEDGKNVLIDSGGSRNYDVGKKLLLPYLLKNGIKEIDMAVITHLHKDHAGGIASLSDAIPIKKVGIYEGNKVIADKVEDELSIEKENFVYLSKGQKIEIGKDLEIEVLYPERKTEEEYELIMGDKSDENSACLVMKVTYRDISVIMTGDIDAEGESKVAAEKAQILKVAHHGSKYGSSKEFLAAVNPKVAVIQVGKNTYGHPSKETLQRLEEVGAYIYRNDFHGAVGIEIKKNKEVEIHTMI